MYQDVIKKLFWENFIMLGDDLCIAVLRKPDATLASTGTWKQAQDCYKERVVLQ